ncbi:MAG TPA: hypothetical protein VNK23_16820 [Candidatus Dormibacteraeota bacterium]|nr:hypothetical protein [Candidatus Dormibacteraeota bacterium]
MNGINTETRRKNTRAKIGSEIAYLNFDSGNGAIVLDVSRDGIGFQAADRLEASEPLAFRLCTSELPNIDLAGDIAWLDETRKRGGLRLRVPAASRAAYQKWLHKHFDSIPEAEQAADAPPSPPPAAEARKFSVPDANANPNPDAPAPNFASRARATSPAGRGAIFVSEWELPPEDSHTGRNVLVLCLILVLGVALGAYYFFGSRRQMGALLIHLGESLVGSSSQAPLRTMDATNANALPPAQPTHSEPASSSGSLAAAQSWAPTPGTAAAPAGAPVAPSQSANGPDTESTNSIAMPTPKSAAPAPPSAPPDSAANAVNSTTNHAPALAPQANQSAGVASPSQPAATSTPPGYGQAEVEQASKLLQDSNPQDSSVAADLLWSAVSKGNTKAEMMLADVYLEGHGAVRKNCQQTVVLLTAAKSANVPGAEEKLEQVRTYGCR